MTHLNRDVFRRRRKQIAHETSGGLVVLSAYDLMQQSADMVHPFRQEANFLYLTGLHEPGWQVVYDGTRDKCWMVRPKLTDVEVLFGGELSDDAVLQITGANDVVLESDFDATLRQIKRQHAAVHTLKPSSEPFTFTPNPAQRRLTSRLERIFASVHNVEHDLADLRAIKQPEEIALIKRAISITAGAFAVIHENADTYKYEYEVEAEFWLQFRKNNAVHAYEPIIASGNNATVLHYEKNEAKIARKHLLLMDCGASQQGYNADVTRTIAIGDTTVDQRQVYEALLSAQQQIIRLITPGLSIRQYHREVDMVMKRALQSLGLMDDLDDEVRYRRYFPHAVSHGLGIDVHESLGSSEYFKPGMILTVEPGIYIAEKELGIRIEDDILVTETGRQNLSRAISTELK